MQKLLEFKTQEDKINAENYNIIETNYYDEKLKDFVNLLFNFENNKYLFVKIKFKNYEFEKNFSYCELKHIFNYNYELYWCIENNNFNFSIDYETNDVFIILENVFDINYIGMKNTKNICNLNFKYNINAKYLVFK